MRALCDTLHEKSGRFVRKAFSASLRKTDTTASAPDAGT